MDPRVAKQILNLEDSRENKAFRRFHQTSDDYEAMKAKQREFEEYRAEHERRIRELGKDSAGVDSEVLANYHQFKGALDNAIDQQDGMLVKRRSDVEASRSAWSASRRRRQALEQLIENQGKERRMSQEKREQKMLDELGLRAH